MQSYANGSTQKPHQMLFPHLIILSFLAQIALTSLVENLKPRQQVDESESSTDEAEFAASPSPAPTDVTESVVPIAGRDFSWAPAPFSVAPGVPIWTEYFSQFAPSLPLQDITVCTGPTSNVWGATLDDGPSENTHVALEYFQTVGMQATFWAIGSNILNFPDVVANTFQSGHQIGSHTWSHPDLVTLSDDQVIAELVYGCKAIQEVTGVYPKYFRPPYGSIDDRVRSLAASMGLQSVTWAVDTQDWSYVSTGNMYLVPQAFQSWLNQGVILPISLEHDLFPETVAVVQQSMDLLLNSGRVIKTVAECIGDSDPYGNGVLQAFFTSGLFESK